MREPSRNTHDTHTHAGTHTSSLQIANPVASEPVPAVVGMAMCGMRPVGGTGLARPTGALT